MSVQFSVLPVPSSPNGTVHVPGTGTFVVEELFHGKGLNVFLQRDGYTAPEPGYLPFVLVVDDDFRVTWEVDAVRTRRLFGRDGFERSCFDDANLMKEAFDVVEAYGEANPIGFLFHLSRAVYDEIEEHESYRRLIEGKRNDAETRLRNYDLNREFGKESLSLEELKRQLFTHQAQLGEYDSVPSDARISRLREAMEVIRDWQSRGASAYRDDSRETIQRVQEVLDGTAHSPAP